MRHFLYKTAKKFVQDSDPVSASSIRVAIIGLLQKWINWDLRRLDLERQRILRKGAKEGKKLPIKAALRILDDSKINYLRFLDDSKASYEDDDKAFLDKIDQLKKKLLEKYGDGIPIDEAWKLTKEGGWDKLLET